MAKMTGKQFQQCGIYILFLMFMLLLGTAAGCWLAEPIAPQLYAANASMLSAWVERGMRSILPVLLAAILFPAGIFVVSQLRYGGLLTGLIVWCKGVSFGYVFMILRMISQQRLLALFILRELCLLMVLFGVCCYVGSKKQAASDSARGVYDGQYS